ncbi:hypothetical protein EMIT0373P_11484 [Pseudomonas chlororaphis]
MAISKSCAPFGVDRSLRQRLQEKRRPATRRLGLSSQAKKKGAIDDRPPSVLPRENL